MAEECYCKSMTKFQKNYENNKQDLVKLYYNLGNLYQITNEKGKSLNFFEKC